MKVELIQATPNAVKLITDVASICYGKDEASYPDKLLRHLHMSGHHSVFEHVYYTFKIEGMSRACLAQLTRHRHASFSVRSQRYCDESMFKVITPDKIWEDKILRDKYFSLIESIALCYDELIEAGIKKEDARSILPQAVTTDLYMSFNLRELIHIFRLRTHPSAQKEIRELVNAMVGKVLKEEPKFNFMFNLKEE